MPKTRVSRSRLIDDTLLLLDVASGFLDVASDRQPLNEIVEPRRVMPNVEQTNEPTSS